MCGSERCATCYIDLAHIQFSSNSDDCTPTSNKHKKLSCLNSQKFENLDQAPWADLTSEAPWYLVAPCFATSTSQDKKYTKAFIKRSCRKDSLAYVCFLIPIGVCFVLFLPAFVFTVLLNSHFHASC